MKMLSWNIRGLNARSKQGLLRERIMKEQPDILLLQETKCAGEEASQILKKCWKQANLVEIDAKGAAGGLVVLWNPVTVLMEGFFYLQLDHHNLLLSHWFEQTRLHHECLWTHKTRRQGSLPPSLRMDFQSHRHPTMDPWG
jgi:exonuclease III